ncbi:MAG: N-acetylmannosamine-6-phosphate 2-epimerase [Ilumatobacteraceae bacterium]
MSEVLERVRGGLIVSCQAYPGEPMLDPRTMTQVAQAAVAGGAIGIRAKGLGDLRAMRAVLDVPLIGLVKVGSSDVYITPTLDDCMAVAATGVEIVATDGTRRPRPDGRSLQETILALKAQWPDVLVMADCGSAGDATDAQSAGADLIGTTLGGYSGERPTTPGPDWELIDDLVAQCTVPVIAEGRIRSPSDAAESIRRGAWAVVVGTAITHPTTITRSFADVVAAESEPS